MLRVLRQEFGLEVDWFAGHSLGEYTALVAAGVLPLGEAARLVRRRGALMQRAVPAGSGAMLAVIGRGLDLGELRAALEGLVVDVANHNSSSQIVVSGSAVDVDKAKERLGGRGRRLIPLNVSAPFHSRLMREVEPAFGAELAAAAIEASSAPRVASNYTGTFHADDADRVRDALVKQISGTVRWVDNMRAIAERSAADLRDRTRKAALGVLQGRRRDGGHHHGSRRRPSDTVTVGFGNGAGRDRRERRTGILAQGKGS